MWRSHIGAPKEVPHDSSIKGTPGSLGSSGSRTPDCSEHVPFISSQDGLAGLFLVPSDFISSNAIHDCVTPNKIVAQGLRRLVLVGGSSSLSQKFVHPPAARGSDLGCVCVGGRGGGGSPWPQTFARAARPSRASRAAPRGLCGSHTEAVWQPHKGCCCCTTAQLGLFNSHKASCSLTTAQLWLLNRPESGRNTSNRARTGSGSLRSG